MKDTRIQAAQLTEEEFLGPSNVVGDQNPVEPTLYEELHPGWRHWAYMDLLEPGSKRQQGYQLHYAPTTQDRCVFLSHDGHVVGIYVDSILSISDDHRGDGLGAELVLAGFCHKSWENEKRLFSEKGHKAFKDAYQLAKKLAS